MHEEIAMRNGREGLGNISLNWPDVIGPVNVAVIFLATYDDRERFLKAVIDQQLGPAPDLSPAICVEIRESIIENKKRLKIFLHQPAFF
jgi:hypothetical protein